MNRIKIITYVLKMFLLDRFCGSFQFFPQISVVLPSFFIVEIVLLQDLSFFISYLRLVWTLL
jgi:hypothetical protein